MRLEGDIEALSEKNGVEVCSHKLQQNTKDRHRKMRLKGDIEVLAYARRALKNKNALNFLI